MGCNDKSLFKSMDDSKQKRIAQKILDGREIRFIRYFIRAMLPKDPLGPGAEFLQLAEARLIFEAERKRAKKEQAKREKAKREKLGKNAAVLITHLWVW